MNDDEQPRSDVNGDERCPVCGGVVRKARSESLWICDGCARHWSDEEWAEVGGVKTPPEPSDTEIVQLMAAQQTIMDHHEHLEDEYKANIREFARMYGVDHFLLDDGGPAIIPDEAAGTDDR